MRTLAENKVELIREYRQENWEVVKMLTQERKRIMRRMKTYCMDCGVIIAKGYRCSMHANLARYVRKLMPLLVMMAFSAQAQFLLPRTNPVPPQVSAVWVPVPDTNVIGYNLYWGYASGQYLFKTNCGAAVSATVTLPSYGTNYFFAVTAYNAGLESNFSAEGTVTPIQSPTNTPPTSPILQPIVILTAQYKNDPSDFQWTDLANFSVNPFLKSQLFRLEVAQVWPKAQTPLVRRTIAQPPLPFRK